VAADANGYIYDSLAAICRILVGDRHVDTLGSRKQRRDGS
jgi:hypothetical protein